MKKEDILKGLLYVAGDQGVLQSVLYELLEVNHVQLEELCTHVEYPFIVKQYGHRLFLAIDEKMNPYIEQLVTRESGQKLTQASMETLSIIAYNQPVTRNAIVQMRGVNSDGPVRTLIDKGLVESIHEAHERSQSLVTTDYFLQVFGLKSLDELPTDSSKEMEEEMDLFFKNMNEETV